MDHPNIARVLDAGATETGRPYFVMELVRGIPITQYCDQEQLATQARLDLFMKVCHAIQHAHQKGIIHRDIKPSNILVTLHDGVPVPKVIDFGIAKAIQQELTEKTIYTQMQQFIGTPAYMSPEQAEMSGLDIDTRSDIYSLGVLLYELLTGVTPFDAKELMRSGLDEMRKIIREREPLTPSSRLTKDLTTRKESGSNQSAIRNPKSEIDKDLDWIVMKCLEKDRTRRYETASSLAMDVKRHLNNEPVIACPPSQAYLLRKLVRRNRGPVLAAVLLLLVLVGGIIGTTWGMIRAEQARRDAVSAEHAEAQRAEGERRAKEEAQKRLAQTEKATEILAAVFRDFDPETADKEGITLLALLARRINEAAQQLEGEAVGDPLAVARLQHVLGISLRRLGHLEQAKDVLVKASKTREQQLGADHLDTAATKLYLAMLYQAQGKYSLAETLYQGVVATRTARLGPDHRDSLASRYRLATLYRSQRKYALAESLHKEVLAIRTAKLGADDPDTLYSQSMLAELYGSQRKYALAESMYQESLAVLTQSLGADHLDTVAAKEDLAGLYHKQGKFALAEPLYQEAVAVRTAKLGTTHPATLVSRHHLATLYQYEGKLDLAEALSKEVLADRIAALGADHPHTLSSQHDLARLYFWQGNYDLAEPIYKEVLAIRAANLGADHLDTAASKYELAEVYKAQAKYDLAESLYQEVLAVRIAKLEPDDLETIDTQFSLARLYQAQGRYALAESLHQNVLAIRTAKLGTDDDGTIFSRDSLTMLYWSMENFDQSILVAEETLKLRSAKLGADHPEVLRRQVALGDNYCDVGRFADGIALIEEVHRKGRQDPKPAWVRNFLLTAYVQAGMTAEATVLVMERVREARQEFPADSPELAAALAENGRALLDAKAYADAEPLLRESRSIGEKYAPDIRGKP